MEEAKYLIDFSIIEMKDTGYIVQFHNSLAVYVSELEFKKREKEIKERISDLKFPEENFFQGDKNQKKKNFLIGIYARGKLQYDAYNFNVYKRLDFEP